MFVGGKAVPNSYVPDGRLIQIRYDTCRQCLGEGVISDDNGEPVEWCECSTGEAVRQAGAYGGVRA